MNLVHITEGCTFPESAYLKVDFIANKLASALLKKENVFQTLQERQSGFYSYRVGSGYYGNHELIINGDVFATVGADGVIHTQDPDSTTPLHVEVFNLLQKGAKVIIKPQSHVCA